MQLFKVIALLSGLATTRAADLPALGESFDTELMTQAIENELPKLKELCLDSARKELAGFVPLMSHAPKSTAALCEEVMNHIRQGMKSNNPAGFPWLASWPIIANEICRTGGYRNQPN